MLPVIAVTDPENARILFDLVNAEFCKGGQDTETRLRLIDLLIALHAEMTRTDNDMNRETTS